MIGAPRQPPSPPAEPPRSGLGWRLATAAAGIPVLLVAIYAGGPFYLGLMAAAVALGSVEFSRAFALRDGVLAGLVAATAAAMALAAARGPSWVVAAGTVGAVSTLVLLIARAEVPAPVGDWALALGGLLYVGLLGQFFVGLRWLEDGREWVYLAAFTTFATDTGAYAVGRLLGRHKLAPRISPGKTVEGGLGGLLAGALAAWALNRLLGLEKPDLAMALLGAGAAVAGQLGDLAESLLKRTAGIKDMGNLLPGHGGILDRLDSLLFVAPLVYYAARGL